ncbi:MAG TPA: sensor histidine kinase [Burkholderiaceae bacterium]|nr:sensor histidine kinase [Burkholderiaceae bacterium]
MATRRLRDWLRRVPGVTPGTRPLRRHLLIWLLLPQLVLWCAAAWVTYNLAARYTYAAIDRSLYLSSRALARQIKPSGVGLYVDFPKAAQDIIETDPDDRVYFMVSSPPGAFLLGNHQLPLPPPSVNPTLDEPYFYDAHVVDGSDDVPVRIAALYLARGAPDRRQVMAVQIAKSRVSREQIARRILVDTALPLTALMLTMSLIVWAGIRAGLAPLARMRQAVGDRAPNDLAPIHVESAPEEVRSLAKALNSLLAAVNESVAGQRRFISDAAHQLRTPLAGLKSQTEIALKEAVDPTLHARLARVHESATRSAHLVNQLLILARAEPESKAAMGRSRFDLAKLAQTLTAEAVPRALSLGIDLGVDLGVDPEADAEPAPVWVVGNALLIREALLNLVDNAIRYAGRGSDVTVGVRAEGGDAVVDVTDTGVGIPDAQHGLVFERFYRASTEGSGCGLGLPIVKEIVERHQGSVELSNVQPHGLTVRVRLPLSA